VWSQELYGYVPARPPAYASDPVSVRQPANSLHASFSPDLTVDTLRFTWIPATRSPEDFHLQVSAHAGRTFAMSRGAHDGDSADGSIAGLAEPRAILEAFEKPACSERPDRVARHHRTAGSQSGPGATPTMCDSYCTATLFQAGRATCATQTSPGVAVRKSDRARHRCPTLSN